MITSRNGSSLNEYFTEWVLHWVNTSLNEYFTEWRNSQPHLYVITNMSLQSCVLHWKITCPHVSSEALTTQHADFENKNFEITWRSHPVEFFQYIHILLVILFKNSNVCLGVFTYLNFQSMKGCDALERLIVLLSVSQILALICRQTSSSKGS